MSRQLSLAYFKSDLPMVEEARRNRKLECWVPLIVTKRKKEYYIMKYESVKTWFEGISANSFRGTNRTSAKFLAYLVNFCSFISEDPDSIVKRRIEDTQSVEIAVRMRYERLVQKFSINGYKNREKFVATRECVVALKSFFRYNGVPLNVKSPRKIVIKPREIMTMDEIRKMFNFADVREKALLEVQVHGFRPETLLQLRYKPIRQAIESKEYPAVMPLSAMELKGAYAPFYSLLGQEACEAIEEYMELRRRGTYKIPPEQVNDSSYLFRKKASDEPLTYNQYLKIIKKLAHLAGLSKNATPYAIRRFFKTTAEATGIPLNWVDYMMFHKPRGANAISYSQPSLEQLKSAFLKVEPFLRIKQTYSRNEESVKLDVLRGIAKFVGVDLEEEIKKKGLKSVEDMSDAEVGGLFDEFRKVLLEQGLTHEYQNLENKGIIIETLARKNGGYNPYHAMIVKSKEELVQKLEEGWDLIRELKDGEYIVRKKNSEK